MRNWKFLIFAFLVPITACNPPGPCDTGASPMSCDNEVTTRKPIGSWTVTETSSSTSVSESGSTDTFTVVLATRVPDGNVVIDLSSSDTGEVMGKKAVMGALTLYLDFINLFIMLLRLFGQRR